MTPELWRRASEIFANALELPEGRAAVYVEQACKGDEELRALVERMLKDEKAARELFARPPAFPFLDQENEPPRLTAGDVLAGRYRIVRFLQTGGMGEVYEAEDLRGGGAVALKTIRARRMRDPATVARFKREVSLAKQVTHPNVCRIYDLHVHAGDHEEFLFLTMELLAGETLADHLERVGPFSETEALPLIEDMAAALQAAHARNVIHRDFKSRNVMLVATGDAQRPWKAVVTDFGLARLAGPDSNATTLTEPGLVFGTPDYMSPEQLEGASATKASDLYALAVVVFEMVTGERPERVRGSIMASSLAPLEVRAPSWVPALRQCLEANPAERFGSALEFAEALRGSRKRRPAPRWVAVAVLAAMALAGSAAFPWWRAGPNASRLRPSIALMGFQNASPAGPEGDLSPAIEQGLRTAIRYGGEIRVIGGETIAALKRDLSLNNQPEFSAATLRRILRYAAAQYVLCGSYNVEPGGELQLSITVQDTASGNTVVSIDQTGSQRALGDLAYTAGVRLRKELRVSGAVDLAAVQASLPSNPGALRDYTDGLREMQLFHFTEALRFFERAIQSDPGFAPSHRALADVFSELEYGEQAKEEAETAYRLAVSLSPDEQAEIEAQYYSLSKSDWPRAVAIYRKLFERYPDNLEYGLRLADIEEGPDVLLTLKKLRTLPAPLGNDARIDLEESEASSVSDVRQRRALAAAAAREAEQIGARVLVARAHISEAYASRILGDYSQAVAQYEAAKTIYAGLGDESGVANALRGLATVQWQQGELRRAMQFAQQALQMFRNLQSRAFEARTLNLIGIIQVDSDRLADAHATYENALKIYRELRAGEMIATVTLNRGFAYLQEGKLAEAKADSQEAARLLESLNNNYGTAEALNNLGVVFLESGDLKNAQTEEERSLELAQKSGDRSASALAQRSLGEIAWERGERARAHSLVEIALRTQMEVGERAMAAATQSLLADWALDEGRPAVAQALAEKAANEFGSEASPAESVLARAVRALAMARQGAKAEVCKVGSAPNPVERPENRLYALRAAIQIAAIEGSCGAGKRAQDELRRAAIEAASRHLVRLQLQARLELLKMQAGYRTSKQITGEQEALASEASAHGFVRVAREAMNSLKAAPISEAEK